VGRGWSTPRPGRSTPLKEPVPIVYEAWWAAGQVWTGAANLASTGIRSPDRSRHGDSLYLLSSPGPPTYSYILYKSRCSLRFRGRLFVTVQAFIGYIFNSSLSGFSSVYTPILIAYLYVSGTCYDMYFLNSIVPVDRLPVEFMEPLKM